MIIQVDPYIDYIFRFVTFYVYYGLVLLEFVLCLWPDVAALHGSTSETAPAVDDEKTPISLNMYPQEEEETEERSGVSITGV